MVRHSRAEILNKIEELGELQPWNHSIELPYGIKTIDKEHVSHGKNLIKWSRIEKYIHELGVKNKQVLDVGCSEGFFSLKLEELGAKEVIAIDADKLRIKKARFISDILGTSNITYEVADIFDAGIEKYGHFDFALCMGFLHRVTYPYKAIQQLTKMSDTILFEWKSLREGSFNLPMMKFCGGQSKDSNKYSALYWLPSVQCIVDILETLGFEHNLIIDDSTWRRTIIISSRFDNVVFRKKDIIDINKIVLLKRITRSYLGGVLKTLKNKKIKWL
jgi:SAM-dependent methyltransferase